MKAGDLYKVISMDTHTESQFGDYVILLKPIGQTANAKYWWVLNISKGTEHHHRILDLEVICK